MQQQFTPGERALVVGRHPHAGTFVTLINYGPYGLALLELQGWLARADDGQQFYCQLEELAGLASDEQPPVATGSAPGPAAHEEVIEVEAEEVPAELAPTISPGKRETTLDKLRAYYRAKENEPVVLTKHQQWVLQRLEAAWGLLLDAKTSEKAVAKLMSKFTISRPQAYRDLSDCKQLFGDVVESNRKADRYLLKELAMDNYHRAKKAGDIQQMNAAIDKLIKITGIEKADPNIPDESVFQPSTYLLQVPLGLGTGELQQLDLETIAKLPQARFDEVMNHIQQSGTTDAEMVRYIFEAARGTAD